MWFWIILIVVLVVFLALGEGTGTVSDQKTAKHMKEMNERQKKGKS